MTHRDDAVPERDPAADMDLLAYVDGTLDATRVADVEARLARDPEAREAVAQWRHYDNVIHEAAQAADTLPANLRIGALERQLAARLNRRRWRSALLGPGLQRIAASVVLFGAGWWAHGLFSPEAPLRTQSYPAYVESTLAGHEAHVFAAHLGVEFSGDNMDEALAWLSAQMQQKIDSPELEGLGYRVESARLITTGDRPVAVFYYRNPEEQRITVSMSPRHATEPGQTLHLARTRNGQMAYWSGETLHYAVVGGSNVAEITTLAAAIER